MTSATAHVFPLTPAVDHSMTHTTARTIQSSPMKEAHYFSHDANASRDPKILSMRGKYRSEGYGWYWLLIEMLYDDADHRLELSESMCNAFAMHMQCKPMQIKTFIEECIQSFALFVSDGDFFWSPSLNRRIGLKKDIQEKRREAAKKRWADAKAMQMNALALQESLKGKGKGKGNRSKSPMRASDDDHRIASLLFDLMTANETAVGKAPDLVAWAECVEKMHRLDRVSYPDIEAVARWSQSDPFWRSNILSASKLRDKYATLNAQMIARATPRESKPQVALYR